MKVHQQKHYRPSEDEVYMNPRQLEYFRQKLLFWREHLVDESVKISHLLEEESLREPDVADQGVLEADNALKLRTRSRYIKLIHKIDDALERIRDGTYGYCEETGKEIGIKRLEVRPTATLSIEAQKWHERAERLKRSPHPKWNPSKAGGAMQAHEFQDLDGIYEDHGGVKCKDCMEAEDWTDLKQENIISVDDIKDDDEWLLCDYYEKRLQDGKTG